VHTAISNDRWITAARRTAVGVTAAPFVLATAMTLVDSYRRRGKRRSVSFPTEPPA
jgi:cardiolipin synthase